MIAPKVPHGGGSEAHAGGMSSHRRRAAAVSPPDQAEPARPALEWPENTELQQQEAAGTVQSGPARRRRTRQRAVAPADDGAAARTIRSYVSDDLKRRLAAQRQWAVGLDPADLEGVDMELRMLRQVLRDAFATAEDGDVRQLSEALRRLLRERASLPDLRGEADEEDGFTADLRRILNRVGTEMGIDV